MTWNAMLSAHNGRAPVAVARGIDDPVAENQHGTGTVNAALGVRDSLFKGLFCIDERGHDFGRVELSAAHFGKEMGDPRGGIARNEFLFFTVPP